MNLELRTALRQAMAAVAMMGLAGTAWAVPNPNLQITEIHYDPLSSNDVIYEWIEVRNTGGTDINLDGAYMDDTLPNAIPTNGQPSILAGQSQNTIIPAGGVAIIYDALLAGEPSVEPNFDDAKFRASWGLAESVPVLGARFFPNLNNSSSTTIDAGTM